MTIIYFTFSGIPPTLEEVEKEVLGTIIYVKVSGIHTSETTHKWSAGTVYLFSHAHFTVGSQNALFLTRIW